MLGGLIERFFKFGEFFEVALETQKDYRKFSKNIDDFGKRPTDTIKLEHVRCYMDKWGIKSRTQANREKAFISCVYL